ncbi:MAG: leucyl aminopeptidase [Cyanobacteria bacterium P01_D01_bin.123]
MRVLLAPSFQRSPMQVQAPTLEVNVAPANLATWQGDCLVIGCAQSDNPVTLPEALATLDRERWSSLLAEAIAEEEFKGKPGSTLALRVGDSIRKIVLVGLGNTDKLKLETLRRTVAAGLRQADDLKAKTVGIHVPYLPDRISDSLTAAVEGALLLAHQDRRFKSAGELAENSTAFAVETVTLLGFEPENGAIDKAQAIAKGTMLARELVAAPANIVTPMVLADTARTLAEEYGWEVNVLDREGCEALGMGAFLGVAQASDMPPQFIHLTYRPADTPTRKLALIGKGLTFDSGGLNLKVQGNSIAMMKIDMGGAAAVLGAAQAIAPLKPKAEVHFIVAATENMISGRALHPGDILTASNQKTIEINNTDAEGRLTLADALVFAEKLGVDAMVDLATLTGACIVALGNDIAGLFSPDQPLTAELKTAAELAGEKIWPMPMEPTYADSLKSDVADMKNTGAREGGSISAALFLQKFVEKTPWAHLDIAGPVWTEKPSAYTHKGATGFGVRTLAEWILAQ